MDFLPIDLYGGRPALENADALDLLYHLMAEQRLKL